MREIIMPTRFADLYSVHFERIAAEVHCHVDDATEAQDLTHEAFCQAWQRWGRVSEGDAAEWVRQRAVDLATTPGRFRRSGRGRAAELLDGSVGNVALATALSGLSPEVRLAVVRHHLGLVPVADIARERGVTEETVLAWLSQGRDELGQSLGRLESAWGKSLSPAGARAAMATAARRNRTRLAAVIAAVAVAFTVPLALIGLGDKDPRQALPAPTRGPAVEPRPSPTVTPPQSRPIALSGVDLPVEQVIVVDVNQAWAWLHRCDEAAAACESALAVTNDGGRTWQRAALPDIEGTYGATLHALDSQTAVLYVMGGPADRELVRSFLVTKDGGKTFRSYAYANAPVEARLAAPGGGSGSFRVLCPGAVGYEDGAFGIECAQEELYEIGEGIVRPRPPLIVPRSGGWTQAFEAGDGRIWLTTGTAEYTRVAYSADRGRSWTEVQRWEGNTALAISPDGREVWMTGGSSPVRLVDGKWEKPGYISGSLTRFVAVGDGTIASENRGKITFYGRTGTRELSHFQGQELHQLPDGTLVSWADKTVYVGTGSGWDRQWIALTWK